MVTVFALVARCNRYPDSLGYGEAFEIQGAKGLRLVVDNTK